MGDVRQVGGDLRISQLPVASGLVATDLFVCVQSGTTSQINAQNLVAFLLSIGALTLNNVTIGNITPGPGSFTTLNAQTLGGTAYAAGMTTFLRTPTSANLAATVTDETGTGALVFANTPTLVTPILGTPTSGNLSNTTNYPIARDFHAAVAKGALAAADEFGIWDSVSGTLEKTTWGNLISQLQLGFTYADATGTADAITATYNIAGFTTLTDGFDVVVGIATPNTINSPTFAPTINGIAQTARTIYKFVNNVAMPLMVGELSGDAWLVYDSINLRWILNTPNIASAGQIAYTDATGTSDAVTGTYNVVNATLVDGYDLTIGIVTPNTTTTPTFAPVLNGISMPARTIVKFVNNVATALSPGDLQGDAWVKYDLPNTRWILQNPANPVFTQQLNCNTLVNGSFAISQVNGTTLVTPATTAYPIDNVQYITTQASKLTAQQVSNILNSLGAVNALTWAVAASFTPAATDTFYKRIPIEGVNFARFQYGGANAKSGSLQFKARASVAGTYSGAIQNYAQTRSYPFSFVLAANTDTLIKIENIPGDTGGVWVGATNAGAAYITFDLGSGANFKSTANSWQAANYVGVTGSTNLVAQINTSTLTITDVQFELGSVSTLFERKLYEQDLRESQRFLPVFNSDSTLSLFSESGVTTGATTGQIVIPLPYATRIPVTGLVFNTVSLMSFTDFISVDTAISACTFSSASLRHAQVAVTFGGGGTQSRPAWLKFNNATGQLYFTGAQI